MVAAGNHEYEASYANEGQGDRIDTAMRMDGSVNRADLEEGRALVEIKDDDYDGPCLDADLLDGQGGPYYRPGGRANIVAYIVGVYSKDGACRQSGPCDLDPDASTFCGRCYPGAEARNPRP